MAGGLSNRNRIKLGEGYADLIDAALAAKGLGLRFSPALETLFEDESGPARCRTFVGYGFAGLAFCYLFLLNYFTMLPDVAWRALLMQVGFTTPIYAATMLFTRQQPPAFWREAGQVFTVLVTLVAAIISFHGSKFDGALLFHYCPVLTLIYINVVVAIRFRFALVASAAILLCHSVDLRFLEGVSADLKGLVASSVVFACAFTLFANYRTERDARRSYLLNAREGIQLDEIAEQALLRAQERDQAATAAAAHALELSDAHRVARIGTWRHDLTEGTVVISDELHRLMGTDPQLFEPTRENLLELVHPEDRAASTAALARAAAGDVTVEHEWRVRRPDGSLAWFWAETHVETDASGRAIAVRGVCQDMTEHRATAERIYRLAHHDALTGVANRSLLGKRLAETVAHARRTGGTMAVLCLDLDGFKAVNDLGGHAAGDRLLREVAARLSLSIREIDTVARLGGDEFVVVQAADAPPEMARALADRLVTILSEPYDLGASEAVGSVSASIGVALYPADGDGPEELLHNADTALYRAKQAGKNRPAFFRPEMERELRERRALEHDLHQAAKRGQFALAWQPLSTLCDGGQVTGFEVLLRWHHPERGAVPPDRFIPVAEACGAINAIGAWVLQEACREAASWRMPLRVAVNVSPVQVQQSEAFAEMVEQALASSGLPPERLVLEVTEGVLIRDPERVQTVLKRLKALGVQVALDDFGTGYSSLATLRALPFDQLKIDRCFIARLTAAGGQDTVILRAMLGLARGLGLPVVAEGVETDMQLGLLQDFGCQEVQGWLVGRPAPIDSFDHVTKPLVALSAA